MISTAELYAAICAVELLASKLSELRVFVFVDNEAARASLISMHSMILLHNELFKRLGEYPVKSAFLLGLLPSLLFPILPMTLQEE